MIDSGRTAQWRPSSFIRHGMNRSVLDYLFITNADQDHMADLKGLENEGILVDTLTSVVRHCAKGKQGSLRDHDGKKISDRPLPPDGRSSRGSKWRNA